ncbi:glycerol-1-phosphate dehydrogenase [Lucifera butyrica]|uniref:Glycerol-1-phosphate dehydrogenase n=1 Tax=Lucifera butyrica TaxID=1351585 RepID=A0A498R823_9FIRM|nr:sn-glycerol-1-phosphate dehydrogenase [Lucifera butyrica]VBB07339.1 glycerol-1-phosphate dehydrogenase [Lucifera butyrica]
MELTMDNVGQLEINQFLGEKIACRCGKIHYMNVDKVIIEKGAIEKVADVVKEYCSQKALIVADSHTYEVAGKQVTEILKANELKYKLFVYNVTHDLVPNEEAIGNLLLQVEGDTDLLITVGSGVLNDLVKFVSERTKIPSIIVATAPSMDGFVSDTSALIIDNLKTSVKCSLPKVIIGDVNILKQAPKRMILAGLGDMIGKYSALIDWQLSRLINGEYYCQVTAKISADAIKKCVDHINGIDKRDDLAIQNIMEGLIRTGIAMSYVGNSRPASGSEHHMSHYWEMMFLFAGKEALLHGTKVGLASIIIARMYELLAKENVDFDEAIRKIKMFDEKQWTEDIKKFYGKAATGIIANAQKDQRNFIEKRLKRVQIIQEHFPEIIALAKTAKSVDFIKNLMKKANAPLRPGEVGIDEKIVYNSIVMAKEVRQRYTILNLLSDLGLLEKYAEQMNCFIQ